MIRQVVNGSGSGSGYSSAKFSRSNPKWKKVSQTYGPRINTYLGCLEILEDKVGVKRIDPDLLETPDFRMIEERAKMLYIEAMNDGGLSDEIQFRYRTLLKVITDVREDALNLRKYERHHDCSPKNDPLDRIE